VRVAPWRTALGMLEICSRLSEQNDLRSRLNYRNVAAARDKQAPN